MITGYNTDVEHDGVVYHVQTEDKGLDSPLILSLVYSGGAILASKRSHYDDLIASGFSEEALAERLKRQHRLICAAIHTGRIEELKRMGQTGPLSLSQTSIKAPQTPEAEAPPPESQPPPDSAPSLGVAPPANAQSSAEPVVTSADDPSAEPVVTSADDPSAEPVISSAPPTDAYTVHDHRRQSPLGELPKVGEGLRVKLLDERPFHSGDTVNLRILVSYYGGTEEAPVNAAAVSVKVLGTTFRPQIYSVKTQRDGIANVSAQIPKFTSGRAAILIRVTAGSDETEMRRVIQAG